MAKYLSSGVIHIILGQNHIMSLGTYRTFILVAGDILLLNLGLAITLVVRYGPLGFGKAWELNILPFSIIFAIWILIFYIARLYEARTTIEIQTILQSILYSMLACGVVSIGLFYFVREFTIAPRINLILNLIVTGILLAVWHIFFIFSIKASSKTRVMLLGSSKDIEELASTIKQYPQLGYQLVSRITAIDPQTLVTLASESIDIVIAPREMQSDVNFVHGIYEALHSGIRFVDATIFYERLLGKIPVALISKVWFLENISETEKIFFESLKRGIDIIFACIFGLVFLPLLPLAAFAIKLDSSGPIFIRQKRVGKMGLVFTLYKFRTMKALNSDGTAELSGAEWSQTNDRRITHVGKILRATRIDELPQLWNVLVGELSFIGPRPERPEFVENLRKEIPFYDMRHLVRPGLSGWAQINPPYYYASIDDTILKLQYDLFYIKNRDIGLDLAIALKTFMVILSRQGR
ncbi:MAG: sugar transferase [Patescibacteria group bacterium]